MLHDLQIWVVPLVVFQWISIGDHVTTNSECMNDLLHPCRLIEVGVVGGGDVFGPPDRYVRDPQGVKDLIVEAVLAQQIAVHLTQEVTRLCALNDAVIIGGGEGEGLGDGIASKSFVAGALPFSGILHGAHADDGSLSGHQPRDRVDRSDGSWISEGDGCASEILDSEFSGASPAHQIFVSDPELSEVHGFRRLDAGYQQLSAAIGPGQVNG